jgi:predicted transcriptional regulator
MPSKTLVEMSAEIVAAQARQRNLSPEEIAESLRKVFMTLKQVQQSDNGIEPEETVTRDPQSSIQRNHVLCLECGKSFKLLSNRHLALHNLTPREYKLKYGIRMTQALSARTLSARRRKLAKDLGMGKHLAAWRAERKQRSV